MASKADIPATTAIILVAIVSVIVIAVKMIS